MAQTLEHIADLRPAAVDHHHPDPHQGEQDQVGDHRLAQVLRDHGVAAVLHHHGLAVVLLDIGHGLGQHLCSVNQGRHGSNHLVIKFYSRR